MELKNYRSNDELFNWRKYTKGNIKNYLLLLLTSVIAADPELYFIGAKKDGKTHSKEVVKFGLKDFGVAPADTTYQIQAITI